MVPQLPNQASPVKSSGITFHRLSRSKSWSSMQIYRTDSEGRGQQLNRCQQQTWAEMNASEISGVSAPCSSFKDALHHTVSGPVFVCCLSYWSSHWIPALRTANLSSSVVHKEFFDLFVCSGKEMIKLCLSGLTAHQPLNQTGHNDCQLKQCLW